MQNVEQDWICNTTEINKEAVDSMKKDILPEKTIISLSEVFKTLGDPTRLKIIYLLSKRNLCVYDIADILNMSQSAISHQLRVLRSLRLVKFRKEGKHVIYSLDDDHVLQLFNQGIEHISHE